MQESGHVPRKSGEKWEAFKKLAEREIRVGEYTYKRFSSGTVESVKKAAFRDTVGQLQPYRIKFTYQKLDTIKKEHQNLQSLNFETEEKDSAARGVKDHDFATKPRGVSPEARLASFVKCLLLYTTPMGQQRFLKLIDIKDGCIQLLFLADSRLLIPMHLQLCVQKTYNSKFLQLSIDVIDFKIHHGLADLGSRLIVIDSNLFKDKSLRSVFSVSRSHKLSGVTPQQRHVRCVSLGSRFDGEEHPCMEEEVERVLDAMLGKNNQVNNIWKTLANFQGASSKTLRFEKLKDFISEFSSAFDDSKGVQGIEEEEAGKILSRAEFEHKQNLRRAQHTRSKSMDCSRASKQ
jgi:hypothetical protein